ncbi:MAG: hypothetical protein QM578_02330 [Pantoea sp.]|uniref:hypothetical protein n=1 Tax=Pantoea sp. TaxID=69393 RepID=UPI0039E6D074
MSGEESNHYTIASYAQELWEIAEKYLDKLRAIAEKDIGPTGAGHGHGVETAR